MPHNAAQYVLANILPKGVGSYAISYLEAANLEQILKDDAKDYFYSATISTASALLSLDKGYYSWATVKLYYSNYYLLRGLLALSKLCILYNGTKPFILKALPAETIKKPSRRNASTTHGIVIECAKNNIDSLVTASQNIATQHPLDWIKERREESNYKHSKFPEPIAPPHLKTLEKYRVRRLVNDYLADKTMIYTFDPDHAMIAYNLFLWLILREELVKLGKFDYPEEDFHYLRSLFIDDVGNLASIQNFLRVPE
jgi:hypothetical protein